MNETTDLMSRLQNLSNDGALDAYIKDVDGNFELSFSRYLNELMVKLDLQPKDLIDNSKLERTYVYQILNGRRTPSRDKIIALSLAMKLDIAETQRLLKLSGQNPLYAKSKRDSILTFAVANHLSVMDTNVRLVKYGESELE